jgi:hypothetical protein
MTKLLAKIRSWGGDVRLDPEDDGRIQMRRGRAPLNRWKVSKRTLVTNKYLVVATLKEERASRAWEGSGRSLGWWRTYPYSRTELTPACTCDALPCTHNHEGPGPAANVVFDPGETVWQALAQAVRASSGIRMLPNIRTGGKQHASEANGPGFGATTGIAQGRR